MTNVNKKIIFFTSSLDNTGSEILLFHFINFLAKKIKVVVICNKKGSLISNLDASVKVHITPIYNSNNFFQKIKSKINELLKIPFLFYKYKKHLWYINTIVLPKPVDFATDNNVSFILHIHELRHMYKLLSEIQLTHALTKPIIIIANSLITQKHLIAVGSKRPISIINPFIDLNKIRSINHKNVANGSYTWVMCGSVDENKNPMLFIEIAKLSKQNNLPYIFKWLYATVTDSKLFEVVQNKIIEFGLNVTFIKTKDNDAYLSQFSLADGLLLTSTVESFSIVTLEALAMGKAIVANNCGGIAEIIDANSASIITLNSHLSEYLRAMETELKRLPSLSTYKHKLATKYNMASALDLWEQQILPFLND